MSDEHEPADQALVDRYRPLIEAAQRQAKAAGSSEITIPLGGQPRAPIAKDSFPGYQILSEIHRGGQGVVYQAIQRSPRRKVAIKVLLEGRFAGPRDLTRFEREVQILAGLKHPNIVAIHESGKVDERLFYVMDYISGQPLDAYVQGLRDRGTDESRGENRKSKLEIRNLLGLFAKICEAMNAAHLRGVIHRDLKPSNIRIDSSGEPHILDFGLAKVAAGEVADAADGRMEAMTVTGQFVGSLPWASPEQAEGAPDKIDVRTDVYSLGVILYQMLTARFPYDVTGAMRDVLDNILRREPIRPSSIRKQIDDEVETIVVKSLAKQRERRYQTAGELARDVRHYLAGEAIEAKRDSVWYVLKKTARRYRLAATVAAFVLVVLTGSSIALSVMYRNQSRQRFRAETAYQFVREILGQAADVEASGYKLRVQDLLDQAAQRVSAAFAGQPESEAELRHLLSEAYYRLGIYPAGKQQVTIALELRRVRLGEEHPDTLASLANLAEFIAAEGDLPRAEALNREALALRRKVRGPQHSDVAQSLSNLGEVLFAQGRYTEAETHFHDSLAIYRKLAGHEAEVAQVLGNLAAALYLVGQPQGAEDLFRESLAMRRALYGNQHPSVAESLNNLGCVLEHVGRLADAEPCYREALGLWSSRLGEEHPNVARAMNNLGLVLQRRHKLSDAEPLLRRALEIRNKQLGEGHVEVAESEHNLALLLRDLGRSGEGESYLFSPSNA